VKLTVYKNNNLIEELDFSSEVAGVESNSVSFFIGRSKSCHLVLDDMLVSREHACLTYIEGSWTVKNNSSFEGLLINGNNIEEKLLENGDLIIIGQYSLNISLPEQAEEIVQKEEVAPVSEEPEEISEEETEIHSTDEELEEIVEQPEEEVEEVIEEEESDFTSDEDEFSSDEGFESTESEDGEESEFSDDNFSDEEGDDEYALETSDGESTQVFTSFLHFSLDIMGEYAPYDKYVIDSDEVFIGRDSKKCQIVLSDNEVSSVHAVIRRTKINCILEDLNSGNGTILNSERINKIALGNDDEFIIGSTTFTMHISSDFMQEEEGRLMPVEENQVIEVEEIVEVDEDFDDEDGLAGEVEEEVEEKSFIKKIMKDPKKKRIVIIVGLLLLALMMMDDGEDDSKKKGKKKKVRKSLVERDADQKKKKIAKSKYTPEQIEFLDANYILGKELFETGKYTAAILELEKVRGIDPTYKNTKQLIELAGEGLKALEELEKKKQLEIEKKERQKKIDVLLEKASKAVKDRQASVAEALFSKILEIDPENFDIPQLKIEIDAWKKEQERIALEKAQKKADRTRKVSQLAPSKKYYLQSDWYRAIIKLSEFLEIKDMDEDLVKDATDMLKKSKENLKNIVGPLLGKARSLKEGQDLKGAYEHYNEVLGHDPINEEALNKMNSIREILNARSKKIYREGIISESLSLFDQAKEKFKDVQQVSPSDSEYYKKATEKLKEYLE
jgi:pSer/pThr/pTyr-binding forkhead associated (FHA) protein/tetratricopeptide (TPR) repeat protein